jgi:hypothetical protein
MWLRSALSAISEAEAPIAFGVEEQYGSTKGSRAALRAANHPGKNLRLKTRRFSRKQRKLLRHWFDSVV